MTTFSEARALVLSHVRSLGTESVPLARLGGRVFAQDLVCPFDVPHFDNSQVDGYAYRTTDSDPRHVVGVSAAGGSVPPSIGPGEAIRIFTGAPLPPEADAVAMQEDCAVQDGLLTVREEGRYIRRRGEEIAAGTRFDLCGHLATSPLVGLAASFGLAQVEAYRTPKVVIVGTGSELVVPGTPLREGQVYASNPLAIAAALRPLGIDAVTALVGDVPDDTDSVLDRALEDADILITVGGVSVGEHDLVRPTLARLGVEERLWRVSMKPGKPFYCGTCEEKLVFGLPGNPVSALVTFVLLVRPALRKTIGLADAEEETSATLGDSIRRTDLRYEFVRATLGGGVATPVSAQGSHMQTGLAFADALIHVPEGVATIPEGERVTITPLRWGY